MCGFCMAGILASFGKAHYCFEKANSSALTDSWLRRPAPAGTLGAGSNHDGTISAKQEADHPPTSSKESNPGERGAQTACPWPAANTMCRSLYESVMNPPLFQSFPRVGGHG